MQQVRMKEKPFDAPRRGDGATVLHSAGAPFFSGSRALILELPALLHRQLIAAVVVRVLRVARVAAKSAPLAPA